ncbi:hypothetical protein B0H10DRAFT_729244 [Mycena sp. CBHHK59/15]|nr:hypothetical protein B0H10DRAFT_729244 [Mycena sp. CBHHK59/15]
MRSTFAKDSPHPGGKIGMVSCSLARQARTMHLPDQRISVQNDYPIKLQHLPLRSMPALTHSVPTDSWSARTPSTHIPVRNIFPFNIHFILPFLLPFTNSTPSQLSISWLIFDSPLLFLYCSSIVRLVPDSKPV